MKGWKTILFNVIGAILLVAENQGEAFGLGTETIATIILVGNFVLRFLTNTPVGSKTVNPDKPTPGGKG